MGADRGESNTDRRRGDRRRVLLTGILIFGPASLTASCAVRDLTETGARVRLDFPASLTTPLVLLMSSSGLAYEADIVWQRNREAGLSFTRQCDLASPKTDADKTARRLWIERALR